MATTISNRDISLATLKASKLALQGTTRNLFKKTGVLIEGASNNHTLQYAGAMGLAAVILHDCGSGRWKKSWHPDKWANKAHWHIENTLFENSDKTRMTEEDKMAGYAEGPHYFMYGFESLAPFLIAYKNAVPENHTEEVDAGFWRGALTVHNHDTRQKFHNLNEWYNQIQMPNGWKMPYDNSFTDKNYPYFLKILNHGKNFHQNITSFGIIGQQYHPDVIASENPLIRKENKLEQHFVNNSSGNIVLQSPFSMPDSNRIQIHLLAETGVAVNGGNHEHADANSVVVSAGNELLIFDPGYVGYSYRKWFNRGDDHNIFTVNDDCPSETKTRNATGVKEGSLLITDISAEAAARVFFKNTTVDRKVSYHNSSNQQYVVSMDRTDEDDWWGVDADFKMILSGNGNANDTTFEEVSGENGMFRWTHPCKERGAIKGTYNIQTYTAVFGQIDGIEKITDEDEDVFGNLKESSATVNENSSSNFICKNTTKQMSGDEKTVGIHTKVRILKESDNQTHFLTVYWPYKCWQTPPVMKKKEDWNFALITIEGVGDEEWTEFLSMSSGSVLINDPADRNPSEKLEYTADDMHLSISSVGYKSFKECSAITRFRAVSMSNGTSVKYNDTTYMSADENITIGYQLSGKFRYTGYVKNEGTNTSTVTIFLPDLMPYYDMIIKNKATNQEITSTYDDQKNELTFSIAPDENIEFIAELADPCLLSCFFPETDTTIHYTFEFDEGTLETLGHHLDIVQDTGHLKITNGSKMFICEDNMLANKDSITMQGRPGGEPTGGYSIPDGSDTTSGEGGSSGGGVHGGSKAYGDRVGSKRAMIIVDNKAGLILESNSHTHIGEYSTIYIKAGGTLLIEDSVEVEIGGEGLGTGELIAEGGAHVCINDETDLHFFINEHDSSDKNIFYVAMGSAPNASYSYVNLDGIKGKFKTDSIYDAMNYYCLDFCELKNYLTPHGINNRDFGWANTNEPVAHIEMNDTFCEGEAVFAVLSKTLNETRHFLKIARYDTVLQIPMPGTEHFVPDTTINGWDSSRVVNQDLSELYPFDFEAGNHYVVLLGIENDCNEEDFVSNVFFIEAMPQVQLDVPSNGCPGLETIAADGTGSQFGTTYLWSVSKQFDSEQEHMDGKDEFEPEGIYIDTLANGLVSAYMTFPDFYFRGGNLYNVSLTALNVCGEATVTKTVDIPLSANITAQSEVIISGGSPSSTQLTGTVTGTSTFSWTPANILDDSLILTPIAAPVSSTDIILTATDGTCSESDTIHVKVNLFANASEDQIICKGSSVEIGSAINNLPSGYTIVWNPTTGLDSPSVATPIASPDSTTVYKLSILDSAENLVEEDWGLVTVLDSLTSEYSIEQTGTLEFDFVNFTTSAHASNTYLWTFGDGDTSILVNSTHTYYDHQKDTAYEVCLIASNICGSDTFCDSLYIDSLGTAQGGSMITVPWVNKEVRDYDQNVDNPSQAVRFKESRKEKGIFVRPNPFMKTTDIVVNYDVEAYSALEIVIFDASGKKMRTFDLKKTGKLVNVNLSGRSSGIYYARLVGNDKTLETVKLILID